MEISKITVKYDKKHSFLRFWEWRQKKNTIFEITTCKENKNTYFKRKFICVLFLGQKLLRKQKLMNFFTPLDDIEKI